MPESHHNIKTKPPPTAAKTMARPHVRPTPKAIACARPAASLVPVALAPPKPAVKALLPPVVIEAPELPVAEDPLEVVDAIELIVEELIRWGL